MSISTGPGLTGKDNVYTTKTRKKTETVNITENGYLEIPFSVTGLSSEVPGLDMTPIKIWNTRGGRPCLLCPIDFDGTIFNTFPSWWEAVKRTAIYFGATLDFVNNNMPAFSAWETGRTVLLPETKHLFGIPENVAEEEMWKILHSFIKNVEQEKPSKMFPGVCKLFINAIRIGVQPVVVTANRVHLIQAMIARETGVQDVQVIQVNGLDKSKVLQFLARYQYYTYLDHYFSVPQRKPHLSTLSYFGDSCWDVSSTRESDIHDRKIRPIYVHRSENQRRGLPGQFDWDEHLSYIRGIMPVDGRIITHPEMADTLASHFVGI